MRKWRDERENRKTLFPGNSETAVRMVQERQSEYPSERAAMLQILSVTLFEKIPLRPVLVNSHYKSTRSDFDNQLALFNY
ncbi:MAG: hypothetical protein ACU84J_08490 [Gammaproteobacteria bacterium]